MKIFIVIILGLIPGYLFSQKNIISENDALNILKSQKIIHGGENLLLLNRICPKDSIIHLLATEIKSPSFDSYLFFIDNNIDTNLTSCKFVFIESNQGSINVKVIKTYQTPQNRDNWKIIYGNEYRNKTMLTLKEAFEVLTGNISWPSQPFISVYKGQMNKNFNISLTFGKNKLISPDFISYVFFIDDEPNAGWTHKCRYVFVNVFTGELIIKESFSPPEENWKGISITSFNKNK